MKKVPAETTVLRLCRALRVLVELEEALGEDSTAADAADEIESAILDLCGVPADTTADPAGVPHSDRWCRDSWAAALHELVTAEATDEQLERVVSRMRKLTAEAAAEAANVN